VRRGETGAKVQIGAELLCKGGKVEAGKPPDYGVQSTDYGVERHEVGAWLRRALLEGRSRRSLAPTRGQGPRKRQTKRRWAAGTSGRGPQHNQARLGWHAVPTLPEASEAARAARGANPTRGKRGNEDRTWYGPYLRQRGCGKMMPRTGVLLSSEGVGRLRDAFPLCR